VLASDAAFICKLNWPWRMEINHYERNLSAWALCISAARTSALAAGHRRLRGARQQYNRWREANLCEMALYYVTDAARRRLRRLHPRPTGLPWKSCYEDDLYRESRCCSFSRTIEPDPRHAEPPVSHNRRKKQVNPRMVSPPRPQHLDRAKSVAERMESEGCSQHTDDAPRQPE
jgi:hypothetical protein